MNKYDIRAKVTNARESGNFFASGYRPAFDIRDDYSTTGEIILIDSKILEVGDTKDAFIRFLTPDVYPNSLWVGKELIFKEGITITGRAIITEIYNNILKKEF